MSRFAVSLAIALLVGSAASHAAETITHTYDARGRLVTVVRSGPVNKTTTYTLDKADNRLTKSTT
jgi:YD repeat-containing protein